MCVYSPCLGLPQDIYTDNLSVQWDDIIGLEDAKQLVKEAVVYPIKVCVLPGPAGISVSILNVSPLKGQSRRSEQSVTLTFNPYVG